MQNKLADYFRRKRSDESSNQQSVDKNISDQENRYLKYMANVDELTRQLAQLKDSAWKYFCESNFVFYKICKSKVWIILKRLKGSMQHSIRRNES